MLNGCEVQSLQHVWTVFVAMQVRADLNVPLSKDRKVEDDTRIKEAIKTLKYLTDHGAQVLLCSHLVPSSHRAVPQRLTYQTFHSLSAA